MVMGITSSRYTIDYDNKTIDLNKHVLDSINNKVYYGNNNNAYMTLSSQFSVFPSAYTKNIIGDTLQIKNENEVIDEYTFINYNFCYLKPKYQGYQVDNEKKIIDIGERILDKINGRMYANSTVFHTATAFDMIPDIYTKSIIGDKL